MLLGNFEHVTEMIMKWEKNICVSRLITAVAVYILK